MRPATSQGNGRGPGAAQIIFTVTGAIAGLIAIGLLVAGGVVLWGNAQKDDQGYISTASERFDTSSSALVTDDLDVDVDASGVVLNRDRYGSIRLRATSRTDKPVFVGIARTDTTSAYLRGTDYATVADVSYSPFRVDYRRHAGERRPTAPGERGFWAASVQGSGPQTLIWDLVPGSWAIVVMNADGSPGVDVGVSAGAKVPFLAEIGWGSIALGLILLAAAAGLMYLGLRTPPTRSGDAPAPERVPAAV